MCEAKVEHHVLAPKVRVSCWSSIRIHKRPGPAQRWFANCLDLFGHCFASSKRIGNIAVSQVTPNAIQKPNTKNAQLTSVLSAILLSTEERREGNGCVSTCRARWMTCN